MTVLNASHLLDQADKLAVAPNAGRPRQVDLRRAVSSAYYAAFHTIVTSAADLFVGAALQATAEHALVMRSIDHATIRKACEDLGKEPPSPKYAPYVPGGGLGADIRTFIEIFPVLQQQRHAADYDSLIRYSSTAARGSITLARAAITAFWQAPPDSRRILLFLILFPPRR